MHPFAVSATAVGTVGTAPVSSQIEFARTVSTSECHLLSPTSQYFVHAPSLKLVHSIQLAEMSNPLNPLDGPNEAVSIDSANDVTVEENLPPYPQLTT